MDYPEPDNYQERFDFDLGITELVWRDHYYFLLQRGYQLRPRYKPGWEGSWLTNGKNAIYCEDHIFKGSKNVLDAIRVSDGVKVALKLVYTHTQEIPIGVYFSSPFLRLDPRNHCVQITDVIPVPYNDVSAFIVMPRLGPWYEPPFRRKIECVEAFHQMLEGLEFMHEHNVAHRDACFLNFVMDATKITPAGFHHGNIFVAADGISKRINSKTRKQAGPMKYYWIDFGLSTWFPSFEQRGLVYGCNSQEKSVPELSWEIPYDPFKVDICQDYEGLECFQPFVEYLTQKDPQLRPSASEALLEFKRLVKTFSRGKLNGLVHEIASRKPSPRSRLMRKKISAWKKSKLSRLHNA